VHVDALLCDAATVRESLLHVLGGGVTRVWRETYPAPLGVELALMITMQRSETMEKHRLRVLVNGEDGAPIASLDGEFQITPGKDARPGETSIVPLVLDTKSIALPAAGVYSVEILIDSHQIRSIAFLANPAGARPQG
jgi:hypothetical protein